MKYVIVKLRGNNTICKELKGKDTYGISKKVMFFKDNVYKVETEDSEYLELRGKQDIKFRKKDFVEVSKSKYIINNIIKPVGLVIGFLILATFLGFLYLYDGNIVEQSLIEKIILVVLCLVIGVCILIGGGV